MGGKTQAKKTRQVLPRNESRRGQNAGEEDKASAASEQTEKLGVKARTRRTCWHGPLQHFPEKDKCVREVSYLCQCPGQGREAPSDPLPADHVSESVELAKHRYDCQHAKQSRQRLEHKHSSFKHAKQIIQNRGASGEFL